MPNKVVRLGVVSIVVVMKKFNSHVNIPHPVF